ncbi:endolytic transglycosylase MltG [Oceanicola sp. 502str15]|uniref:endolytic transglycosylase MltG n=1 Tax=Oceanicola sp. 502str15 TaxID=2696061 RepID=UPI0020955632|nr:endolytic transglycosylase MltG [Oceanicola sp. 502str15]MCO6381873.1 endolytic transglycosylase MltG [Oceanicola sp. 502str15]
MWRSLASNGLTIIIVLMIGLAVGVTWAQKQYTGPGPLAEAICLQVRPGSNMGAVSDELVERGAVSNGMIFRMGAEYTDRTQQLKAGSFLVPEGSSMQEIVDSITTAGRSTCGTEVNYRVGVLRAELVMRELDPATQEYVEVAKYNPAEEEAPDAYATGTAGADVRFRVTLAEGVTSWQVVESLKAAGFLEGTVEVPAEGSLAPDSYEVRRGSDMAVLVERMQSAQQSILAEAWAERAEGLPYDSPEEALVMASIVEKETGVPEERGQVASVFVNRLEQGMKLQTDPTVIYGVTQGRGSLGRGLRQSELRARTDYNTYVIDGLPPTPIANPGRASIEAALNPDTTPFIFFVADGTGGHAFAETLEEHNENVARWREIEAERAEGNN